MKRFSLGDLSKVPNLLTPPKYESFLVGLVICV